MKFTVENSDIQEVKRVLDEWCDIKLNDDQAKSLIENNSDLSSELFECEGNLDTQARGVLFRVLVDWMLKEAPSAKNKTMFGPLGSWRWPLNIDSSEYKAEFDEALKKAALTMGVVLGDNWN